MGLLSVVIPHWPLDEETDEALRLCVSSFPPECERIVVVNDGTGYGRNVNVGLRLATGKYVAVVNKPGGFHGSFWVVPRDVLDRVGTLDERFEGAYWEDDDFLLRVHKAGIPTRQVGSVRVKHRGGLTTVKIPEHRSWLDANERRFEEKWGFVPPPIARYRRRPGSGIWHFCQNCPQWPAEAYEEAPELPDSEIECAECASLRDAGECAFY